MDVFARATRTTLALLMILAFLPAGSAEASDSLLIWSPAKLSSNAYRLRMGAKTATGAPVSAGVDVSVTTSSTGRIRDTRDNTRLWAEMRGQGGSGAERNVSAGYNPLTGRVSATAGLSRRWMSSPSFDVVVTQSVTAEANVRHGDRGALRMVQKAQLQALRTGTSFVASGAARSGEGRVGAEFGIEQRVFDCLDLAASARREDASLIGGIKARLRFDW
ncbi:hypothetical protein [Sinorhizobium sp. RAC02]|uniref:hypothetical protein n=1 Tax=Sinorhizobium sp. RAC02 TaxID=1842534 RepID=UPI00083DDE22|nr:hypothetical protein [Sinorhizobium sp. RAC02]AOF90006.1 hypothetical protein BSY16_1464 [Sinorhizobium sp. RAC02]